MHTKTKIVMAAFAALAVLSFAEPARQREGAANDSQYILVFNDEFNLPNGSQPDPTKWSRCPRFHSLWNRWVSDSKKVVYIKGGKLVCRAIPNRTEKADTARMLTGAIWSRDKYAFKYGKLLVRMKTNVYDGNFPAAWLGQQRPTGLQMPYGEIDVVEMFGKKKESCHTAHTQYTIDNPRHGLRNAFRHEIDVTKWHVYGIEWTPDYVKWTVDGEEVGAYYKVANKTLQQKHQWTFDSDYYILLNQSVGDGVHDMKQDVNRVYETQFDWIRVYQKQK